jgi:hypothetical protein
MQVPKKDISIIEKIILDTYYSSALISDNFSWDDFLKLLLKVNSNSVHSKILNETDISDQEFFYLLKKIKLAIKLHRKTGIKYSCGKFSTN